MDNNIQAELDPKSTTTIIKSISKKCENQEIEIGVLNAKTKELQRSVKINKKIAVTSIVLWAATMILIAIKFLI